MVELLRRKCLHSCFLEINSTSAVYKTTKNHSKFNSNTLELKQFNLRLFISPAVLNNSEKNDCFSVLSVQLFTLFRKFDDTIEEVEWNTEKYSTLLKRESPLRTSVLPHPSQYLLPRCMGKNNNKNDRVFFRYHINLMLYSDNQRPQTFQGGFFPKLDRKRANRGSQHIFDEVLP